MGNTSPKYIYMEGDTCSINGGEVTLVREKDKPVIMHHVERKYIEKKLNLILYCGYFMKRSVHGRMESIRCVHDDHVEEFVRINDFMYRDKKYISFRELTNIVWKHICMNGESSVHIVIKANIYGLRFDECGVEFFRLDDHIVDMIMYDIVHKTHISIYKNGIYTHTDVSQYIFHTFEVSLQFDGTLFKVSSE